MLLRRGIANYISEHAHVCAPSAQFFFLSFFSFVAYMRGALVSWRMRRVLCRTAARCFFFVGRCVRLRLHGTRMSNSAECLRFENSSAPGRGVVRARGLCVCVCGTSMMRLPPAPALARRGFGDREAAPDWDFGMPATPCAARWGRHDSVLGETWTVLKSGFQPKQVRERLAKGLRTEKRNVLLFDMAMHDASRGERGGGGDARGETRVWSLRRMSRCAAMRARGAEASTEQARYSVHGAAVVPGAASSERTSRVRGGGKPKADVAPRCDAIGSDAGGVCARDLSDTPCVRGDHEGTLVHTMTRVEPAWVYCALGVGRCALGVGGEGRAAVGAGKRGRVRERSRCGLGGVRGRGSQALGRRAHEGRCRCVGQCGVLKYAGPRRRTAVRASCVVSGGASDRQRVRVRVWTCSCAFKFEADACSGRRTCQSARREPRGGAPDERDECSRRVYLHAARGWWVLADRECGACRLRDRRLVGALEEEMCHG
ncbi:hypothetical protein C8F04DRAFT_1232449 [Mycena alexandri]|uniref:Uncharacterized protein n=1 Tax=Mycena alexandri TaxID=1745969 RepID=A0AAD6X9Z4_9AGAR|nr:hypothetical protein C8F04DRAFT_1232449 [Mycena alexandri]